MAFMSCLLLLFVGIGCQAAVSPEQVHISFTENANEIRVAFAVMVAQSAIAGAPIVHWGGQSGALSQSAPGTTHTYGDGGFNGTLCESIMTGLQSGNRYYYAVEVNGETSKEFSFKYNPVTDSIKFISYGDMGVKNSYGTADAVTKEAATGEYDLLVNVGDTSYADNYKAGANAYIFDTHFREIEPYAASLPFMCTPGNHEAQYSFAGYLNRLHMPVVSQGALNRFYYSFNHGPVHFLAYSSEHTFTEGSEQWKFIKNDLATASAPAQRKKHPWIVMWSHRPLYCSDQITWQGRCVSEATKYRAAIESLMVDAHVDLHISGHNHQYERSWPVYGCSKGYTSGCNISKSYNNALAPVHIVNGAAGDEEGIDPSWVQLNKVPFVAKRAPSTFQTGYSRVSVNRTALHWEYVFSGSKAVSGLNISNNQSEGVVYDTFTLTKTALADDLLVV